MAKKKKSDENAKDITRPTRLSAEPITSNEGGRPCSCGLPGVDCVKRCFEWKFTISAASFELGTTAAPLLFA